MLLWSRWANPEDRPAFERRAELARDFGEARADWMIENSRNLCLYPNVYLMDQFSSQIRIARPPSVDRTEITIYCIAPKGESAEARARRIRQYEDFFQRQRHGHPGRPGGVPFLPAGLPGQRGRLERPVARRRTLDRGAPTRRAAAIDLRPRLSGVRTEDEGLFVLQHRYWQEALLAALSANGRSAWRCGRWRHEPGLRRPARFPYREARYLDDKDWDAWLALYAADASFWMPSWDDRDQLTEDPQREISLIWYGNRGGLEDRVFRIRTERSSATLPDTRTSHNLSNIELLGEDDGICRALQLAHPELSLQDRGQLLRHHLLRPRRTRRESADQGQESDPEERLRSPADRRHHV